MSFSHKYNFEDIHLRAVVRGLVNLLNNKIFYKQILDDETEDVIQVPFYFQMTGDERFLQNHFLEWSDCSSEQFAEGNYEIVPRGVVKLDSDNINTSALTNRFIRATYTKEINGKLESFSANINPIPLDQIYKIEIVATTLTDLEKVKQAILETFVFVQIFNVKFKGFMIRNQVKFPDSYTTEKNFEYSFPDEDNDFKLTFSLDVETYYPVIDVPGVIKENFKLYLDPEKVNKFITKDTSNNLSPLESRNNPTDPNNNLGLKRAGYDETVGYFGSTERHLKEKMKDIIIGSFEEHVHNESISKLTLISPIHLQEIESGKELNITWSSKGFVHKIDLLYSTDSGITWNSIEKFLKNNEEYKWTVPNLSNIYEDIIFISEVGYEAKAKALIDATGSVYSTIIENPGYGYDDTVVASVVSIVGSGTELKTSVLNGKIVDLIVIDGGSGYVPNKTTNVNLLIKSSASQSVYSYLKDENENLGHIIVN